MARQITYEPCTLVYSLLDTTSLNFDDFYLIVRGLHSFMVESVTPNKELNNVHVKLAYQASLSNAQNKLGKLRNIIGISKLSSYIEPAEFSRLELLRQRFGLNEICEDDEPGSSKQYKPTYGRGRGRPRGYGNRSAPYPKKHIFRPTSIPTPTITAAPIRITEYNDESNSIYPDAQQFPDEIYEEDAGIE